MPLRLPKGLPKDLLEIITSCLQLDPLKRPTAEELLRMPQFNPPRTDKSVEIAKISRVPSATISIQAELPAVPFMAHAVQEVLPALPFLNKPDPVEHHSVAVKAGNAGVSISSCPVHLPVIH